MLRVLDIMNQFHNIGEIISVKLEEQEFTFMMLNQEN